MTRSDILIAVVRAEKLESENPEMFKLIWKLHAKIENAYQVLFGLEQVEEFKEIGKVLRDALEQETL